LLRSPLLALLAAAAGCGSPASEQGAAASASGSTGAPPPAPSASAGLAAPDAGTTPWESVPIEQAPEEPVDPLGAVGTRPVIASSPAADPVFTANADLFAEHFASRPASERGQGLDGTFPLEMRGARLAGGRRALLFTSARKELRPLVLLVDGAGHALWRKERPLAGTHERWRGLTLTAGPEGSVLIFWWDESSRAVAGRRWGFDGSIFADFHFFDVDDCSGLDALYWPGRGWVVTAVGDTTARSAMLGENGFRRFGDAVLDVGGVHEVLSPAVAAAGVDGIFYAYVGRTRAIGSHTPAGEPRLWATFRREDGTSPWKAPVDVGPVTSARDGGWPRPTIELVTPARARVSAGALSRAVSSDGKLAARAP
jgi:hypothetical protein